MNNTMTLEIEGKEIIVSVIKMWTMNNTNYIAYTDGSKTDAEENLFVSKYSLNGDSLKLESIESEEEWNEIDAYLDKNVE